MPGTRSNSIFIHIFQDKKEDLSDQYFDQLRKLLMDKVTYSHLVDHDFTIDNAKEDPNLTELKEKIFEVAKKQQYWGELIPARWITLEKALVELRNKGLKVDFPIVCLYIAFCRSKEPFIPWLIE